MQAEPGSPDYGGPYPLSTPEARIIKLAADTASPHAFIALQSGALATPCSRCQRYWSCCGWQAGHCIHTRAAASGWPARVRWLLRLA